MNFDLLILVPCSTLDTFFLNWEIRLDFMHVRMFNAFFSYIHKFVREKISISYHKEKVDELTQFDIHRNLIKLNMEYK